MTHEAFAQTLPSDQLIGAQLGEYRIIERLAQSATSIVYRAEHALLGKPVALKVLLGKFSAAPTGLVDVLLVGQLPDGRPYLVTELLSGRSLAEALRYTGRFSAAQTLHVLEQAMAALADAHAEGVVHGDLRPQNLLVEPCAEGWRATLVDFGLARALGRSANPAFMAPEQASSPAADVYAMGAIGWTLLSGAPPFRRGTPAEVMRSHISAPLPPLATDGPLPEGLEALLCEMLSKEPARRPSAAAARKRLAVMRAALRAPKKRTPRAVIAAGVVALVIAALAVVTHTHTHAPEPAYAPVVAHR